MSILGFLALIGLALALSCHAVSAAIAASLPFLCLWLPDVLREWSISVVSGECDLSERVFGWILVGRWRLERRRQDEGDTYGRRRTFARALPLTCLSVRLIWQTLLLVKWTIFAEVNFRSYGGPSTLSRCRCSRSRSPVENNESG